MSFTQQIAEEIKLAMRAKDKVRLTVLRALKTALTNAAIEKGGLGTELSEAESISIVRKQLKQREDSQAQFEQAGRQELAQAEKAEMEILHSYLPAALSEAEMKSLVEQCIAEAGATSKAQMGAVMKLAQTKAAGRADGKALSQLVAQSLS